MVRSDAFGDGNFGSPRGLLPGGAKKFHDGIDIIVVPGEDIVSPISGRVVKIDYPYAGHPEWMGLEIENLDLIAEVWYIEPNPSLVNQQVIGGVTVIGRAQDISKKYSRDMIPHIHFRLSLRPLTYLLGTKWDSAIIRVNPEAFIQLED